MMEGDSPPPSLHLILPLCLDRGWVAGGAFMTSDRLSDVPVPRFSPCLTLPDSFQTNAPPPPCNPCPVRSTPNLLGGMEV